MSKIVPVSRPLPTTTLQAGHEAASSLLTTPHPEHPSLRRWMLGDDYVPLKVMADELGVLVAVLRQDETRSDIRRQASDRLRRLGRRYRIDAACGGVEVGSTDDAALRSPDAYASPEADRRIAA